MIRGRTVVGDSIAPTGLCDSIGCYPRSASAAADFSWAILGRSLRELLPGLVFSLRPAPSPASSISLRRGGRGAWGTWLWLGARGQGRNVVGDSGAPTGLCDSIGCYPRSASAAADFSWAIIYGSLRELLLSHVLRRGGLLLGYYLRLPPGAFAFPCPPPRRARGVGNLAVVRD